CYQIGTEFIEAEIRILEASCLCTRAYAIHAICIAELVWAEFLETLRIGSGKGICGVFKSIVLRSRCKWRSIILNGKIWGDIALQPKGKSIGFLAHPSHHISCFICIDARELARADILQVILVPRIIELGNQ